ncbi:MAG: hypothetical protein LBR16_05510 [Treponema sp.]|jgi:hypothetical protein|nr:hypothetical protein [Treponema sp.]
MIQFYFLAIVLNVAAGLVLIFGDDESADWERLPLGSDALKLVLGILTGITALLKLLTPVARPYIIGDLFPAAAGGLAAFILLYGYYRSVSTLDWEPGRMYLIFGEHKKVFGTLAIVSGVLHFFFAGVLIL